MLRYLILFLILYLIVRLFRNAFMPQQAKSGGVFGGGQQAHSNGKTGETVITKKPDQNSKHSSYNTEDAEYIDFKEIKE